MRTLIYAALAAVVFTSCKAPLPVYFDKPVGVLADSFPKEMQGNFYPVDKIIRRGVDEFEKDYYLKDGKIVEHDTSKKEIQREQVDVAPVAEGKTEGITLPDEEDNFYKIAHLNTLAVAHLDAGIDSIDRNFKIVFGYVKVYRDKITLVVRDSSAKTHESVLLQLNKNLKLTKYLEEYYLNIRTPDGWELLKMEAWNNGEFLNMIPFYFTNYNDKTGDVMIFLNSTRNVYPNLKPIYNSDHLITGFKAIMDPKTVREKFRQAENNLELIRAGDN